MLKRGTKGFTLIELLVVVSIVSLLSSIVLANVATTREKARIAGGKLFDDNMYHALGAKALGYWALDEGSGTNVHNSLGGVDGTVVNGTWTVPTEHGPYSSKVLHFTGPSLNTYVQIPDSSNFPDYTGAITVSAWVNLDTYENAWQTITAKEINASVNRSWWFGFSPPGFCGSPYCIHWSVLIIGQSMNCAIPNPIGRWRHYSASYNVTTGVRNIYVDGKFVCSTTVASPFAIPSDSASISAGGSIPGADRSINGSIQSLRIYADTIN